MTTGEFSGLQFHGMKVLQSIHMTESGEPVTVRRSWRERLWSWPWRPWIRSRTVVPQIPYRGVVRINPNTFVVHPATFLEMQRACVPPSPSEPGQGRP